ncbi:NAD(P)-dependent dehydrogenase (short-subunit alcohol dehydrogenase family) [Clavibacter sp. B3I6]|uniref:SDR family NAD(P)-dependent oxidoreductase n=1 Tax=Clavibacter sp. B3I6 TaxID=3042268 RepID=UPI002782AD94|nr:SDR family NAD(P)-dependent oxidoreductase [Clavibacter sp. B3I6]MDQ0743237.1 NAD(P)-dependent dehydrogenase (short-subunit alcohol dehydrogenase family) [Clavibacter sp. B3I6]
MSASPVLPDLAGRTILVTGANGGIGFWTSAQLAGAGARVLLACRSAERGDAAARAIRARVPGADVDVVALDLARLASVDACVAAVREDLDAIVANAGLTPAGGRAWRRRTTVDGFEELMGTNALGHFALVAGLAPRLRTGGRVVMLGSLAHRFSPLDLGDLAGERRMPALVRYGRSKTACMMIAAELDRRWRAAGSDRVALSAHPGYSVDALTPPQDPAARPEGVAAARRRIAGAGRVLVQGKDAGAWPVAHAAAADGVTGGAFWGPGGPLELKGPPAPAFVAEHARSRAVAAQLWSAAEDATGIRFRP